MRKSRARPQPLLDCHCSIHDFATPLVGACCYGHLKLSSTDDSWQPLALLESPVCRTRGSFPRNRFRPQKTLDERSQVAQSSHGGYSSVSACGRTFLAKAVSFLSIWTTSLTPMLRATSGNGLRRDKSSKRTCPSPILHMDNEAHRWKRDAHGDSIPREGMVPTGTHEMPYGLSSCFSLIRSHPHQDNKTSHHSSYTGCFNASSIPDANIPKQTNKANPSP